MSDLIRTNAIAPVIVTPVADYRGAARPDGWNPGVSGPDDQMDARPSDAGKVTCSVRGLEPAAGGVCVRGPNSIPADVRDAQIAGAMGIWADPALLRREALADFAELLRAELAKKVQPAQLYDGSTTITVRDGELARRAAAIGGPDYLASSDGERALRDLMTAEPNVLPGFWFSITKRSDSDFDITMGLSTPI